MGGDDERAVRFPAEVPQATRPSHEKDCHTEDKVDLETHIPGPSSLWEPPREELQHPSCLLRFGSAGPLSPTIPCPISSVAFCIHVLEHRDTIWNWEPDNSPIHTPRATVVAMQLEARGVLRSSTVGQQRITCRRLSLANVCLWSQHLIAPAYWVAWLR